MEEDENQDPQQNEIPGEEPGLDPCTESARERGAEHVRRIPQPLGQSAHCNRPERNASTQANCSDSPCGQQAKNSLQRLRGMNVAAREPNDCGKMCQRDSRKKKQLRRRKACMPVESNIGTRHTPEAAVPSLHGNHGNSNPEKEVVSVLLSHLTSALQHIGSTYGATLQARLTPEPESAADLGPSYFGRLEPESTEDATDLHEDGVSTLGIRFVRHPRFPVKKDQTWRYNKSASAGFSPSLQRVPPHSIIREALPYRDCLCNGGLSSSRNSGNHYMGAKQTSDGLGLLDSYILSPASLDCLRRGLLRNMGGLERSGTLGGSRTTRTEKSGQAAATDLTTPAFSPATDLAMRGRLDPLGVELGCPSRRSGRLSPSTGRKPVANSPLHRLVGHTQGSHPSEGVAWGLALGNGGGISNGQQRPLNGGGCSNSGNQPGSSSMSQTCPDKAESSSVPCHQGVTNRISCSDSRLRPEAYDPFNPTDEENINGGFLGGDFSPKERTGLEEEEEEEEPEEEDEEKYDPLTPPLAPPL